MNWKYFDDGDYLFGESREEYVERKKAEYTSTRFMITLFRIGIRILIIAVVYSPLLFTGYWITKKIENYYHIDTYGRMLFVLLFAYLLLCLVFFLKGILVALKMRKKWVWTILWLIFPGVPFPAKGCDFVGLYYLGVPNDRSFSSADIDHVTFTKDRKTIATLATDLLQGGIVMHDIWDDVNGKYL